VVCCPIVVQYGDDLVLDTTPIAARHLTHRSSVSNGSRLFAVAGLDGRTQTARRFRDLIEIWTNDLGGPDLLGEGQRQLIRRAASLSIMAESIEADLARDMDFDVSVYGTVCDRLRRICETLGLERTARTVNDGANVLTDYFSKPPPKALP
jgi:hypothetical protein